MMGINRFPGLLLFIVLEIILKFHLPAGSSSMNSHTRSPSCKNCWKNWEQNFFDDAEGPEPENVHTH
jgi:hypothetical protein